MVDWKILGPKKFDRKKILKMNGWLKDFGSSKVWSKKDPKIGGTFIKNFEFRYPDFCNLSFLKLSNLSFIFYISDPKISISGSS